MKLFYEWMENVQHYERNTSHSAQNILERVVEKYGEVHGKILCVRFALYCAENVFNLVPAEMRADVEDWLGQIKKWLNGGKVPNTLPSLNMYDYDLIPVRSAWYAMQSAASERIDFFTYAAHMAAHMAAWALDYQRSMPHYLQIANSLLSDVNVTSSAAEAGIKDVTDLAVFFDEIEDSNLLIHDDDLIRLNLPGIDVSGRNNQELANNIFKHPGKNYVIDWLNAKVRK